ncbi:hypothetical protein NQZ68_035069 [Dissostichus eleginoides]|nr:hypothetical protein NQZ68_035069 [Dissostichus eleginoides]
MRNTLLRMLAALMCALTVCADITPAADFDLQKMSGKWNTVALATNAPLVVNNKAGMKTGALSLTQCGYLVSFHMLGTHQMKQEHQLVTS